jgi:transcriptional regulator GlxA family with amidase domain
VRLACQTVNASVRAASAARPSLTGGAHLHEPLTVTAIGRHANLTERTLIRHVHATTGTTPVKWLTAQRIGRARELLEASTLPLEDVGEAAGLGAAANFRRHFIQATGVTRSAYRRTFNSRGNSHDNSSDASNDD